MTALVAALVYASQLLGTGAALFSIARPERRTWPPPGEGTWQARFHGVLALVSLPGLVLLGLLDWNGLGLAGGLRFAAGGPLMACALFALWGFTTLGAHASQGFGGGLVRAGPYRFSRNPQYVGTVPALFGVALLCGSGLALVAAALGSVNLLLLPFAEEPWLRERLGPAYDEYAAGVPRFLGWPRG